MIIVIIPIIMLSFSTIMIIIMIFTVLINSFNFAFLLKSSSSWSFSHHRNRSFFSSFVHMKIVVSLFCPLFDCHISYIHRRLSFSPSPFWVFMDPSSHPEGIARPAFSVSEVKPRMWAQKMNLLMMRTAFLRTTWVGGALFFFPKGVIDAAAVWASAASFHIADFSPVRSGTAL